MKGLYIGIGVIVLIIILIVVFSKKSTANTSNTPFLDIFKKNPSKTGGSTNTGNSSTGAGNPDVGGWTINGEFVGNQYPPGSDNVIPSKTTYATDSIAAQAYAGDIGRAIAAGAKVKYPFTDGSNRTKLLKTLEKDPTWMALVAKIKADKRIDMNVKGQLISVINSIAWDGILANAQGGFRAMIKGAVSKVAQFIPAAGPIVSTAIDTVPDSTIA